MGVCEESVHTGLCRRVVLGACVRVEAGTWEAWAWHSQ